MKTWMTFEWLIALAAVVVLAGCGAQEESDSSQVVDMDGPPPMMEGVEDDAHAHGDQGPHGGHLIELGRNHKYHAEIVEVDDDQSVLIYLLDTNMNNLSVDDSEVLMNIVRDGEVSTFKFEPAKAADGSRASHFVSQSADLFGMLHTEHEIMGKLNVKIEGVPYAGQLAHEAHDHAGHVH